MPGNKIIRLSVTGLMMLFITLLFCSSSGAITIRASATTINPGQSIRFTVNSTYNPSLIGPNCILEVNFGDGSRTSLPRCTSLSCTASTSHIYNRPGIYQVITRPQSGCATLAPPTSAAVTITVRAPRLTLTVTPTKLQYDSSHPTLIKLTYNGRSTTPANDTLNSNRGTFLAGATTIGTLAQALSAPMTNGTTHFTENLNIPKPVIDKARQMGVNLIKFQRTFTSTLMNAAATSTEITLNFAPGEITLQDGVVGLDYSDTLGDAGDRYQLISGQLPPGLKLDKYQLRGIPTREGNFRFLVKIHKAASRFEFSNWYKLKISRALLQMSVTPTQIQYNAGHPAPLSLKYQGRSTAALNDTLKSDLGTFLAGNKPIGTLNRPLSAPLTRGRADFSESLSIPSAIIDKALQLGISKITFQRSFSSSFMVPDTTETEISLKLTPGEITLKDGVVGLEYSDAVGDAADHFQLISGRLPPRLRLEKNLIKGIPTQEASFRFQLKHNLPDRRGAFFTWYNLRIGRSTLRVSTAPSQVTIDRNQTNSFKLTYTFTSSAGLNDTLTSDSGVFLVNGTEISRNQLPLSVAMSNGRARLNESVSVPAAVLRHLTGQGADRFIYQRTFVSHNLNPVTTSTTAVATGIGFRFTKIKLTFADKTSKKFVKRNARNIEAQVELRYGGAGLLKGYWQADNRILSRITKDLTFADDRTIIFKLPPSPPLPTHTPGSHRLRFVITNPQMTINFPQIIYIVSGEELSSLHPIQLITPQNRTLLSSAELSFSWKLRPDTTVYYLEIFPESAKGEEDLPAIFSAYSRESTYTVPEVIIREKFSGHKVSFTWQVSGFNQNNQVVARSPQRSFTLE